MMKNQLLRFTLVLAFVLSFSGVALSGVEKKGNKPSMLKIPHDVIFAARVDVAAIRDHKKLDPLLDSWKKKVSPMLDNLYEAFEFDFNDVDGLWLLAKKNKKTIFIIEGDYNLGAVEDGVFGSDWAEAVEPFGSEFAFTYDDKGKTKMAAFYGEKYLVVGAVDLIKSYCKWLGNNGQDKNPDARLKGLIDKQAPLQLALMNVPKEIEKGRPLLKSLKTVNVYVDLLEKATLRVACDFANEEDAKTLLYMLKGAMGLGLGGDQAFGKNPFAKTLVDNMTISQKKKTVNVKSFYSAKTTLLMLTAAIGQ